MNESFMRKIYEAGPELDENMMQQGLNFYGQQFKNLSGHGCAYFPCSHEGRSR